LLTFFDYPDVIRPSIYTTNPIEGLNKNLKRKFKSKIQFPSEESLEKYLVSHFDEYNFKASSRTFKGFGLVLAELQQKIVDKYRVS
jgi:transposase-like protein